MAKLPWYMKQKKGKIHFHWIWVLFTYLRLKLLKKQCDHSSQAWQGKPLKRICQKCGADRTKIDGW